MKKVFFTLLGIMVVVGVLAGAGFAGYRIGYMQGATANADGTTQLSPRNKDFGLQNMPMHNFGNNFERGFNNMPSHHGFGRGMRGVGFGFFAPFQFLVRIAVLGIIIWLAYKLFTGNGWKLSLTRHATQNAETKNEEPEQKND